MWRLGWLASLALGAFGMMPRAAEPPPDWLATSGAAGLHLKLGEVWASPAGGKILEFFARNDAAGAAALEQTLGLPLEQIDRLGVIVPRFAPQPEACMALHVTSSKPINIDRLLEKLSAIDTDRTAGIGKSAYRLANEGMLFVGGPHSYSIFFNHETAVLLFDRLLRHERLTPEESALQKAIAEHTAAVWLHPRDLPADVWREAPVELQPLRDAQTIIWTGDIRDQEIDVRLQAQFRLPGHAADGLRAMEEGRAVARDLLGKHHKEFRSGSTENKALIELIVELQKSIAGAKLRQSGTTVHGQAKLRLDKPVQSALVDGVGYVKMRSNRLRSQENLKQIALALHNYESAFGRLPPAAKCDQNGKPLLSWRVAILPFLKQDTLYRRFKMDEPWDSDHNKKLLAHMPDIYRLPGDRRQHAPPSTYYLAFVGDNTVIQMNDQSRLENVPDGTSNTIWLAEAADAVPWTKPADIAYAATQPPKIGHHFGDRCNVGYADASVRSIRKSLQTEVLHLLIQKNDGQVLPKFDD